MAKRIILSQSHVVLKRMLGDAEKCDCVVFLDVDCNYAGQLHEILIAVNTTGYE